MGAKATYDRYDVAGDGPGLALVKLSREGWCPSPGKRTPGTVTVRIGPVGIGPDNQPALERVTGTSTFRLNDCSADGVTLAAPSEPWRIEVEVAPTFVPNEVDPSHSDRRELGGVVFVGYQPLFEDG